MLFICFEHYLKGNCKLSYLMIIYYNESYITVGYEVINSSLLLIMSMWMNGENEMKGFNAI